MARYWYAVTSTLGMLVAFNGVLFAHLIFIFGLDYVWIVRISAIISLFFAVQWYKQVYSDPESLRVRWVNPLDRMRR